MGRECLQYGLMRHQALASAEMDLLVLIRKPLWPFQCELLSRSDSVRKPDRMTRLARVGLMVVAEALASNISTVASHCTIERTSVEAIKRYLLLFVGRG